MDELKERLKQKQILLFEYPETDDFREKFTHDLYQVLLNFNASATKSTLVRKFWRLGLPSTPDRYQTLLIYPPASPPCSSKAVPAQCDLSFRFTPLIVFEDYKAILSLNKTLQLAGASQVGDCGIDFIPAHIEDMNRVWICVPRSIPAQQRLEALGARARFKFIPRRGVKPPHIEWRTSGGEVVAIHSPVDRYITEQSKATGYAPIRDNREIVAKDFAILARFPDLQKDDVQKGFLMDYFIAGIRGIGTWGAAWFLDRSYQSLKQMDLGTDASDVQILLEITYAKGRIQSAKVVSDESPEYFKNQLLSKTVKSEIQRYRSLG